VHLDYLALQPEALSRISASSIRNRLVHILVRLTVSPCAQCLKYRTDEAQDVRKMDRLNALFLRLMSGYERSLHIHPSLPYKRGLAPRKECLETLMC